MTLLHCDWSVHTLHNMLSFSLLYCDWLVVRTIVQTLYNMTFLSLRPECLLICLSSGDNILTAVSVARQCGLVPADDKLVFVNAYSPGDGEPARIDWVSQDDSTQTMDPTSTSLNTNKVRAAVA